MRPFEYFAPRTLNEAVALLGRYNGRAGIIAGGTDLIVEIKENIRRPDYLVDINKIPGLDHLIYDDSDGLKIGALTTVRSVEQSPVIKKKYPSLFQAASQLGSIQVRNRATVAGNICRASPSADTPPPLMAAGAWVKVWGPAGERKVWLEEFFTGPGQTVLTSDEILTEIGVPRPAAHTSHVYIKHGRRKAMELASVGVAVSLTLVDKVCRGVRIVLGAVAPTPIRAKQAEAVLEGGIVDNTKITAAANAAMADAKPISDVRSSAAYRKEMVGVLTERAISEAWQKTKCQHK